MSAHPPQAAEAAVTFDELLQKLDAEFGNMEPSPIERFQFEVDGMMFDVRRINQQNAHRFLATAVLGYLPYRIESQERRDAIKKIVMGSRALPNVRFSIDSASKISAGAMFDAERIEGPDFIFYPLTRFLQEARPFMQLIGKYLHAK